MEAATLFIVTIYCSCLLQILFHIPERDHRNRRHGVAAEHFFHPDHVVPSVKFTGAAVKCSDWQIPHFFVKAYTVKSEVLILLVSRNSDAGVGIEDVLPLQKKFIPCANTY